ncbi:MAG: GMC family oxidoreductase, partial [Hyphomonas sp.]|nr:GMC family oxidoreductase [Hyphomonas sp.]
TDFQAPWDMDHRGMVPEIYDEQGRYLMLKRKGWTYRNEFIQFFVDEKDHPYSYPDDRPFMWTRGYQLGGRSLTWARQSYRWGPKDFEANAKDGHGVDWPIRYADLAPWYDYVEAFAGISGSRDGLPDLPDGDFLKPWEMSCAEDFVSANINRNFDDRHMIIGRCANLSETRDVHISLGRGGCQSRNYCMRGCSYGAYFSSLSATLPAAERTGNLTVIPDAIVSEVIIDPETNRATHVKVIDYHTKEERLYSARVIFLNASAIASTQILLNSRSEATPNGVANSSGQLGNYIMDHFGHAGANGTVPGFDDRFEFGRKPTGIYIPNYRHDRREDQDFDRGFGFQGGARRSQTPHAGARAGIGAEAKSEVGEWQTWTFGIGMFGEMLPYADNTVRLHPTKTDAWGIPLAHLDCHIRENERKMIRQAEIDAVELLTAGGCTNIASVRTPDDEHVLVGGKTHEMGGACMGNDPSESVLNAWNQAHDVANLFVTDGACMSSCGTANPSLTYMALTARAARHAVELLQEGQL